MADERGGPDPGATSSDAHASREPIVGMPELRFDRMIARTWCHIRSDKSTWAKLSGGQRLGEGLLSLYVLAFGTGLLFFAWTLGSVIIVSARYILSSGTGWFLLSDLFLLAGVVSLTGLGVLTSPVRYGVQGRRSICGMTYSRAIDD